MLILKVCPKKSNITKAPVAMKVGAVEAHADVFQLHIHGLELVFDSPAQGNDMFFFSYMVFRKIPLEKLQAVETLPGFATKSKKHPITSQSGACHQNPT